MEIKNIWVRCPVCDEKTLLDFVPSKEQPSVVCKNCGEEIDLVKLAILKPENITVEWEGRQ
jgi:uncharacterized Zn finger protein